MENKIDNFFAGCFFGLMVAVYFNSANKVVYGLTDTTVMIIGVMLGVALVKIIVWGLSKLKQKGNNRIIISTKRIRIEGAHNMTEVTMVIPNAHKDKILSALKEGFGIGHENLRMMAWEDDTHSKFSFVLDRDDMHTLKKALIAMYRTMAGLDKITYN